MQSDNSEYDPKGVRHGRTGRDRRDGSGHTTRRRGQGTGNRIGAVRSATALYYRLLSRLSDSSSLDF